MTDLSQPFVDPTIPGLSARDLVARADLALNATAGNLAAWRRELMVQRDLRDLDPVLLRDIGLDNSRS